MRHLVLIGVIALAACQSANAVQIDPRNATYSVDQRAVTLKDGVFEEPAAPGSAAKTTIRLHEKGAAGELNADGRSDAAAVLTKSGGGSGTFYYVAALLGNGTTAGDPTNAVILGDRIGIDAVRIAGGTISLDVLDRRPGEPFTTAPSVKVTRTFQVKDRTLAEIK